MQNFIPDMGVNQSVSVPFFEDARSDKVSGHATTKTQRVLQQEVDQDLAKLGAFNVQFTPGTFEKPKRYGFRITFQYKNARGRIEIAALPLRTFSEVKKDKALRAALYMLRDKLRAEFQAAMYLPGAVPLVPYLIGPSGETVTEALMASGTLPMLPEGNG